MYNIYNTSSLYFMMLLFPYNFYIICNIEFDTFIRPDTFRNGNYTNRVGFIAFWFTSLPVRALNFKWLVWLLKSIENICIRLTY